MRFELEGLLAVDLQAVRLEVGHPHEAVFVHANGTRAAEHLLRLKVGHRAKADRPKARAHGGVACYIQDPDGNWLELLQLG